MAESTTQWRGTTVPPPPRTLNVTKFAHSRADELQSLHSLVSTRLNGDFRSQRSKRRRTTGYDNRAGRDRQQKRRRRDAEGVKDGEMSRFDDLEEAEKEKVGEKKKLPRRIRRRIELKNNPKCGFVTTGDGTRRLRTHVWHAKRFTMTKLWGFHLPLGLHGSGRGSRAVLKWYKQGAVVHDASYLSAVQLEGSEETLLSIMSSMLEPPPLLHSVDCSKGEQSGCLLCGAVHGSSILHHFEETLSQAICPAIYMWRPVHQQCRSVSGGSSNTNDNNRAHCTSSRQLWIWMHPSAFDEGYNALKSFCQKKMHDSGHVVKCFSLEGQLAKLDVMGLKGFSLLQRILHPVIGSSLHRGILRRCSIEETASACQNKQEIVLEDNSHSPGAVVPLLVSDPRFISNKRKKMSPGADMLPSNPEIVQEQENKQVFPPVRDLVKYGGDTLLGTVSDSEMNGDALSGCNDLWDIANGGVSLPMEESVLSTNRHRNKLNLFSLKDTGSELPEKSQGSAFCPILLLSNTYSSDSLKGWSIVLPVSWVKAFWNPLITSGAHAIGLREKRWIACDNGLPHFPSDFPDCKAYNFFKETEAISMNEKLSLRPPKVRPFKVPILPPWCSTLICSKVLTQGNKSDRSDDMKNSSMEVVVARTPNALAQFCGEACYNQLLLWANQTPAHPTSTVRDKIQFCEELRSESVPNQNKKLCYLRVLLHAFRDGVFEEGAVIYAPQISDVLLLKSSSEVTEAKLHIPQSSLRSYFKEQLPDKWEFNIPNDDSMSTESYRHPLGFVTTGFVRGSKKPVASGFCEATALARLRQEQLSSRKLNKRKEVFVLIRNLRSISYRLAVASIVLEMQENENELF